MLISVSHDKWAAQIVVSDYPDPQTLSNVECRTAGDSKQAALDGAKHCLAMFASGRLTAVRVWPEADTDFDFDTKEERHRGYCRFSVSFKGSEDDWRDMSSVSHVMSLGELHG